MKANKTRLAALEMASVRGDLTPVEIFECGLLHQAEGRPLVAERHFRSGLGRVPGFSKGHVLLGDSLSDQERWAEAAEAYTEAVRLEPALLAGWNNLGNARRALKAYGPAEDAYRQALALDPGCARAWRNLGLALQFMNRSQEAVACTERAVALAPEDPVNRWTCARVLPILYEDTAQIQFFRDRYARLLEDTARFLGGQGVPASEAVAAIWDAFHLHYQGQNDRKLQAMHGRLIHEIATAAWPEHALAPPVGTREKVRVGFASSMWRDHTISFLFRGWMEGLDPSRFEVHGYLVGARPDAVTASLAEACASFRVLDNDVGAAADVIREDALDVLIYPELGMNRHTLKLAALRLAPVQCVAWGHPVTTGLPSIDYFLSSEAMEPPDGQTHYTETLHPLPGLSLALSPPPPYEAALDRSHFGLPGDRLVCLVPQALFKLLPQYDWIYAEIAARLPDVLLVFLANRAANASRGVVQVFQNRLEAVFRARGLDWREFVHLKDGLPHEAYRALNRCSDLFLDAPGWSGGRTTLEAVGEGLLPVTLPGALMRQRHSAAILRELGLVELIAADAEDYVEKVVALGADAPRRQVLRGRLRSALPNLYNEAVIPALEAFLLGISRGPG